MTWPRQEESAHSMATDLRTHVETSELKATQITARTRLIYDNILTESSYLDGGNFTAIHTSDLSRLFDHYDTGFFEAQLRATLGRTPLRFRLSRRMTTSGGQPARSIPTNRRDRRLYEISVSTTLLSQCFAGDDHRPITVTGITCRDRLEALQRVLEHELIHLIELLLWTRSSCSASRFQSMAKRFFGHTKHTHALITPRERAWAKFGMRPGDPVRFRFKGAQYTGIVNRITKRATVLVRKTQGRQYGDGHRYARFYVPVESLETLQSDQSNEK